MKPSPLLPLALLLTLTLTLSAQSPPAGYILQYKQDFTKPAALNDFHFDSASAWKVSILQGNQYLHGEVSAENRAVLKDRIFGDFILEADIRIPEKGQAVILLDIKDSTRYYHIRLSADSTATGIFLMKNGKDILLPLQISHPAVLKPAMWHKVRVERNIVKRTIRVYAGDMVRPLMEARDWELVMGSIGFGAAAGVVGFDNVGVWAPTVIRESEK